MKKLICLALALMMILSLATTAFAEEPEKHDSITINKAKPGETYDLYKLFDLTVNSETEPTAYTYTVNDDWAAFFAEDGDGFAYITINEAGAVTDISNAEALAKAAAEWAAKPVAVKSVTVGEDENTAVFTDLENGYWLVTSTLGTVAMTETTPAAKEVTITEKNPEDTITKEVKEDSTGEFGEANDAQVGDTVEFKSTVTLVKGTRKVIVHDWMTEGLTFHAGSVVIDGLTAGTDYTVNEAPEDQHTFDVVFTEDYLNSLTETVVLEMTYSAVINENAVDRDENVVAIVDQYNRTMLSYGNNQSVEDETVTTTHKVSIFKHATGSEENLAGAVFSLKKAGVVVPLVMIDDNNYRVAKADEEGLQTFTTVAAGDIVIWGVDADDDYTLEEIQAPVGYNMLTEEVPVTVGADNATRIDVENKAGAVLPSTGGMGTTLFYIVGGILVLAAVVLLVTKKRMNNTQ